MSTRNPGGNGSPWLRIAAEAVAIVLSILLAFAIDAWWDERSDRLEEQRVLQQLTEEFEAVSTQLERYVAMDRRTLRNVSRIDSLMQTALADGRTAITVRDSTLRWLVTQGTFRPTLPTLDGLRTSGRLTLIQDEELVTALSAWPGQLEDAVEHQEQSLDIIFQYVYPAIMRTMNFSPPHDQTLAYVNRLADPPPPDARSRVPVTLELANAVNTRAGWMHFSVMEMSRLQQHVAGILELLAEAQR